MTIFYNKMKMYRMNQGKNFRTLTDLKNEMCKAIIKAYAWGSVQLRSLNRYAIQVLVFERYMR
jgi:hypothetical protein